MKLHRMNFHALFHQGIVCMFGKRHEADSASLELMQAGFAADRLVLLEGQAGMDWLDVDGTRHGRLARFVRKLQKACSEGEEALLKRMEEALRTGRTVLIVTTHGKIDERQRVRAVVRKYTEETLYYCGALAIEEIPA